MAQGLNRPVRLVDPEESAGANVRRVGGVTFWAETLTYATKAAPAFVDVTDDIAAVLARSGVTQGWVSVFSKHTTAAVVINENEPRLVEDMAAMLERLSASTGRYKHNDLELRTGEMNPDECANGHAHCQHLLLGSSENIPVAGRRMELGQWQRIFLLELDRPRQRQLVIQVFGA